MAERFIRFQEKVLKYNEAVKAVVNALTKEAGELYDKYKENVVSFLCEQILTVSHFIPALFRSRTSSNVAFHCFLNDLLVSRQTAPAA